MHWDQGLCVSKWEPIGRDRGAWVLCRIGHMRLVAIDFLFGNNLAM